MFTFVLSKHEFKVVVSKFYGKWGGRKQTGTILLKPKAMILTLSFKSCSAKGRQLNLKLSKTRVLKLVLPPWLVSKRLNVFWAQVLDREVSG